MVSTYDTEEQRVIHRIRCIAFREGRDDLSQTGGKSHMINVLLIIQTLVA